MFHLFRHRSTSTPQMYLVRDRLHEGRMASVAATEIANLIGSWLADLDVHSPLVDQLAHAARLGDWTAARAIAEHLSVDISYVA